MQQFCAPPLIPFVSFDFPALLTTIRTRHFPNVALSISANFLKASRARSESLASINFGGAVADIRIHEILNRADTPEEVIEHILKHEILHIVIRPRQIDSRTVKHPPEFWEAEKRISPEREEAWDWLSIALIAHLRIDEKREAAMIRRGWERSISNPFPTFADARELSNPDTVKSGYI